MVLNGRSALALCIGGLLLFAGPSIRSQTLPEEEAQAPTAEEIRALVHAEGAMLAGIEKCEASHAHRSFALVVSARFLDSLRLDPVITEAELQQELARGRADVAADLAAPDACQSLDLDDTYVALFERETIVQPVIGGDSPLIPPRPIPEGGDDSLALAELSPDGARCEYAGQSYEHGDLVCISDRDHRCRDGRWVALGTRASCR